MPRGPLSCSAPWFTALREQMKVLPGSARSGTKVTAFPELSAAREGLGLQVIFLVLQSDPWTGLMKNCMFKAAAGDRRTCVAMW